MIRIQNATRRYGDVLAVDDVSASIQSGEVVGLLGHNGAGKTTLMKMLTGALEPTEGSLFIANKSITDQRIEAQQHVGYLPESAPLYPEMPVFNYLMLMAELRGVERNKQERAVLDAAVSAGLSERLAQPIHELSKGFRQRVGIAQAIVHSPDVLILDEPTNGLDPVQIESIRVLIKKLAERTTIILSTHILHEVEAVCDRVLILIGGKLVKDASLKELLHSNRLILSLNTPTALPSLRSQDFVREALELGADPHQSGNTRYAIIARDEGPRQVKQLLAFVTQQGWEITSFHPEERTLESVFKDLQRKHVKQLEVS